MIDKEKSHRPVRSYVLRQGRMTPRQRRAMEEEWPRYGIEYSAKQIDLHKLFGNNGEITLEIGFGMGDSLLEQARQESSHNFIGIEVHEPGVGSLLAAIAENDLTNIRVIRHDAIEVLRDMIPTDMLDRIQIFFPDPWPKKRHHKRRLIQPAFIDLCISRLKRGGKIHLATDWEHYAEQMMEVLSTNPNLENAHGNYQYAPSDGRFATKFEKRGEALGHGVWDLVFLNVIPH